MRLLCYGILILAPFFPVKGADAVPLDMPEARLWNYQGTSMKARLVEIDSRAVKVVMGSDGWSTKFWLDQLSDTDRDYVQEWRKRGFGIKPKAPAKKSANQKWPKEVTPDLRFNAKLVRSTQNSWTYETPNYRYYSDVKLAPSLIEEYAMWFEGTYAAIREMPLQLEMSPPAEKFVVRLFKGQDDYLRAGGLQGSSGSYIPKTQEILVPLSALGVRLWGEQIPLDRRTFDSGPLVHEITHQVMHYWVQVLPVWFVEGMAEYMSSVPFNGVWYDFENVEEGIRKLLEERYDFNQTKDGVYKVDMVPPREVMKISHEEWNEALRMGKSGPNYCSALLMVYFFAHLDSDPGEPSPLVKYLKLTRQGRDQREQFVAEYNKAIETYKSNLSAFNESVDAYNTALLEYRQKAPDYNKRVRIHNEQVARGVPQAERISVGLPPTPPNRPQPPVKPQILINNPQVGAIDLSEAESEARDTLLQGRTPEELWKAMEEAFAKRRIWIRAVGVNS